MMMTANEETAPRAPKRAASVQATGESPRNGTLEWRRGKARLRLSLGSFGRRMLTLPTCRTQPEAEERRVLLVGLADKLVASGQAAIGFPLLQNAAKRTGAALGAVVQAIERLANGEARAKANRKATMRQIGEQWTSGELHRLYPDHVRTKKTAHGDAQLLKRYVYPFVADLSVESFTLDHADRIMAEIPADREKATRRHVAQAMHKLLAYAVFPLRLITASPFPKGWLPRLGPAKAKAYLYPDEEVRLLALCSVPLAVRLLYGFLAREGMRSWSEAAQLEWSDIDLDRGILTLDKNKTNVPRAWKLRPDVLRALRIWRKMQPKGERLVFGADVNEPKPAELFRARLTAAGIDRPQLFERSAERLWIRVHGLRDSFITIALANGRTESWIADRTGHRSSIMINRYKQAARTADEAGLGDFAPLDAAIPELAAASNGQPGGAGDPSEGGSTSTPANGDGPGTALVHVARAVASGARDAYKTSGSQRPETHSHALKSVAGRRVGSSPTGATTRRS